MKRFFKKASLLLIALLLVAGSVLPSLAVRQPVDGIYSYHDDPTLSTGLSSPNFTSVKTYFSCTFTGTWNDSDADDGNVVAAAECRGGYLDTHRTDYTLGFLAEENGVEYYWDATEYCSVYDNARYFEHAYNFTYEEIYSYAEAWTSVEFTATAGGESRDYFCDGHWTPGQIGWVMDYYE